MKNNFISHYKILEDKMYDHREYEYTIYHSTYAQIKSPACTKKMKNTLKITGFVTKMS